MTVRTTFIGAQERSTHEVEQSLAEFRDVAVERRVPYYPEPTELLRLLRAVDPDVLFVSTERPDRMESVVEQAIEIQPNLQVVLLDWTGRNDTLRRAMQLGVRECLTAPFHRDDLRGVVERSMSRRRASQTSSAPQANALYSFMPVKPGVGASTIAVQTALAMPRSEQSRTLLIDADLEAGFVRFMLQLQNPYALVEALERVTELDEHLWPQLVTNLGHFDVLHAGEADHDYRIDLPRLQHVLAFARRHYSTIAVDLPGAINRTTLEIMQESKAIYLVTTTEVAALHAARAKIRQLQSLQLGQQLQLIVNRTEKKPLMSLGDVEQALGVPVHCTFANEYAAVQKALLTGKALAQGSPLAQQFATFAAGLSQPAASAANAPLKKRRLLEVFSLSR